MRIYEVVSTLPVGEDTSVIVNVPIGTLEKGTGILDDAGKPHEIASIGMTSGDAGLAFQMTSILIKGKFASRKIFV